MSLKDNTLMNNLYGKIFSLLKDNQPHSHHDLSTITPLYMNIIHHLKRNGHDILVYEENNTTMVLLRSKKEISVYERFLQFKKTHGDNEFVSIEHLSNVDAQYLLENMHKNRKPRPANLAKIRRSLIEKGWTYPSFLVVSKTGKLLDGQHRLICLSEMTDIRVSFVVAWNADEEAMYHIDTGVSRSVTDVFEILDYSKAKYINILVKSVLFGNCLPSRKQTLENALLSKTDYDYKFTNNSLNVPVQTIEIFYRKHQFYIDSVVDLFCSYKKRKVFPASLLGVFVRALKENYCTIDDIRRFLELYYTPEIGYIREENQPFLLSQQLESLKDRHSYDADKRKYKIFEKSLNYFLSKKELKPAQLSERSVEKQPELFPVPEFDFKEE